MRQIRCSATDRLQVVQINPHFSAVFVAMRCRWEWIQGARHVRTGLQSGPKQERIIRTALESGPHREPNKVDMPISAAAAKTR